jgi:hypothetical protein
VEQVLDAKLCEQKSSTTKKKPRQECPFHRKVASLNSNACGKLLGSRSRSRPAIYPRLSRRRRLCSRLWSATTAWNWVIPMKRLMPPCRTQERLGVSKREPLLRIRQVIYSTKRGCHSLRSGALSFRPSQPRNSQLSVRCHVGGADCAISLGHARRPCEHAPTARDQAGLPDFRPNFERRRSA